MHIYLQILESRVDAILCVLEIVCLSVRCLSLSVDRLQLNIE